MTYDEQNERQAATLDPVAAGQLLSFLVSLEAAGEDVLVADAARSSAEQDELYRQGRTKPGNIVTHVNDGNSFHTWGVAVDLVPVNFGFPAWNDYKRYETIARIAKEHGFDWGFALWGFDKPHFQYTQGLTIADFKAGRRLQAAGGPVTPQTEAGVEARVRRDRRKLARLTGPLKDMMARRIARQLHRRG